MAARVRRACSNATSTAVWQHRLIARFAVSLPPLRRIGTHTLGASRSKFGARVSWPVTMFFNGLPMAVTPIVGQNRGAARMGQSGHTIRQMSAASIRCAVAFGA